MSNPDETIPDEAIKQAKLHANGYVYKVDGDFELDEDVPPEAVVGAWKVDRYGNIVEPFIPNPNFKPRNTEAQSE